MTYEHIIEHKHEDMNDEKGVGIKRGEVSVFRESLSESRVSSKCLPSMKQMVNTELISGCVLVILCLAFNDA